MNNLTLKELANQVASGEISSVSLVETAYNAAAKAEDLNIFISTDKQAALAKAKEIDGRIKDGKSVGKLAGIPFACKDNFLVNVGTTTAASNMLGNFEAPYTATALQKILNEDAILIGKTNLDAFAHGTSTENSDYGPTKNPVDPTKVPGGSSGGSTAVVAAGIVPFSLGTDTGGSIRLPSSFCGVVGFKPTYGLISRYGVVAMASSTDCIGPIATNSEDIAYLTDIMKGQDKYDSTTINSQEIDVDIKPVEKLKIGIIKEFLGEGVDKQVQESFEASVKQLESLGHEVLEVSIPSIKLALACYYVIVPAEISSNLGRYDGMRYGYKSSDTPTSIDNSFANNRSGGFGQENKRRILIGTYVLSSGYYDAYYKKAQQLRTKLIQEYKTAFENVDILVSLVAPFTAFELGGKVDDPVAMYMADIMTVSANLVGVPAISVPITPVSGLPVGLQLMAPQGKDGLVIALSKQIQGDK